MRIKKTFRSKVTSSILVVLGLVVGFAPIINIDNKQATALEHWEETGWSQVSSYHLNSCAITTDNKAYCWGSNNLGQLGNGMNVNSNTPVAVDTSGVLAGKTIKSIETDGALTCVIASDDQVYCWGWGAYGQLGNGANVDSNVPVAVDTSGVLAGKTIKSIKPFGERACVIASDDQVYCWGQGNQSELGNGSSVNSNVPVAVDTSGVLAGKTVKSIKSIGASTCVIASDDQVYCWGQGAYGQLGNGSSVNSNVPVAVDTSGVLAGKTVKSISADRAYPYACVIASDDQVYCWGSNAYGKLGNASNINSNVPVAVDTSGVLAGKTIRSVASAIFSTCAIASDDQVYCWGNNDQGQLGNGSNDTSNVPVAVDTSGVLAGKTIEAIDASSGYVCALASDNQVYCWGYNSDGQLGNNSVDTSNVPVAVDTSGVLAGKTIEAIDASSGYVCALASDQRVYCWGANNFGQLGNSTFAQSNVPVVVEVPTPMISSITVNEAYTNTASFNTEYIYGSGFDDGSTVKIGALDAVVTHREATQLHIQIPSSPTPGTVDIVVTNSSGRVAVLEDGFTYNPLPVKQITNVGFSVEDNKKLLTVTGTAMVGLDDPSEYTEALSRSLVSFNNTPLPFCAEITGYTAEFLTTTYAGFGFDLTNLVSDDAPCYYLFDASSTILITMTQAVVLLPSDFDTSAPGSVSVNGSPTFSFNQTATPTPTEPPVVVNPPETTKVDDKAIASPVVASRSPIVQPTEEGGENDSTTVATVTTEGRQLSDGHTVIDVRPTFKGKAPAGSTVTVTVHSDPVSCTATADDDGNWSCTLDRDLPEGRHTVRLSVVTPDNQTLNYGPYPVTVGTVDAAKDVNAPSETFESAVAPASNFLIAAVVTGAAVLIAAVVTVIVIVRKRAV